MSLPAAILIYTKANVASVSNRVFAHDSVPAETIAPYIAFDACISKAFSHVFGDDSGYVKTRVQFSVFSKTIPSGNTIIGELKAAYRNYRQPLIANKMGGVEWVQATILENEINLGFDEKTGLYHKVLDVFFEHVEE